MSNGKGFTHLVKLLLIGDTAVGKSSVLLRYSDDQFSSSFITTIGIDFKIKAVQLGDKKIKLQIWDTAGQERFKTITTAYYRGAMGILLAYDVTNAQTFENVKNWMRQIEMHAAENVIKIIIGNKCDVAPENREVTREQGEELAAQYGVKFFETSAKADIGVVEAFEAITNDVVDRLANEDVGRGGRSAGAVKMDGDKGKGAKKKGCCS